MNRYSHKKTTSYKRNTRIIITCVITSVLTLVALKNSKKSTSLLHLPHASETSLIQQKTVEKRATPLLPPTPEISLTETHAVKEPMTHEIAVVEKKNSVQAKSKKESNLQPIVNPLIEAPEENTLEFNAPIAIEEILKQDTAPDKEQTQKRYVIINPGDINVKYKHWSGEYSPTTFTLFINNHSIDPHNQDIVKIPLEDDMITAEFSWNFRNGYKTGKRLTVWKTDAGKSDYDVSFNWKSDTKISFKNAQCIKVE